jgi:hypothetical protein
MRAYSENDHRSFFLSFMEWAFWARFQHIGAWIYTSIRQSEDIENKASILS